MAYNIFNQIAQNAMAANRQQASKANPNQVIAKQPNAIAGATNMLPGLTDNPMVTRQYQAAAGQQGNGGTAFRTYEPTVQTTPAASTWRGKTSAPDGGFFDWAGRTYTTPEQEAQYKRQSMSRMGIMALGDALRHLGNIYHTTKYAPSQQFNAPVQQEYAMYKAGKAERDKDNYAIQQQKLAQAKWDADQAYKAAQLGWKERDYKLKQDAAERAIAKDKQNQENWEKNFEANQAKIKHDQERQAKVDEFNQWAKKQDLGLKAQRNAIAQYSATHRSRGGGGSRGGGSGRGTTDGYHISGRYGHLGRKKELSAREVENAYEYGLRKGWISKEDDAKVRNNGSGMTINPSDGTITYNGGKYTKREMINKMLDASPDALDYFEDKFGMTILDDTEGEPYFQDSWWNRTRNAVRSGVNSIPKSAPKPKVAPAPQQKAAPVPKVAPVPKPKQQVRANQQTVNNARKAVSGAKSRTQQNADILSSGNKNKKPLEV